MPIFAITYFYSDDQPGRERALPAHRQYMSDGTEAGTILMSGPLGADEKPGGLIIISAEDRAEAQRFVEADPLVVAGQVAQATTTEWIPKLGRLTPAI